MRHLCWSKNPVHFSKNVRHFEVLLENLVSSLAYVPKPDSDMINTLLWKLTGSTSFIVWRGRYVYSVCKILSLLLWSLKLDPKEAHSQREYYHSNTFFLCGELYSHLPYRISPSLIAFAGLLYIDKSGVVHLQPCGSNWEEQWKRHLCIIVNHS